MSGMWTIIKQTYPKLLHSAAGLLSPSSRACLACAREFRKQPEPSPVIASGVRLTGICPDCSAAVPWITRIACPVCGRPEACGDCSRRNNAHFISSRSAVRYDPFIRQLLALYKYRGHEALAPLLGEMLQVAFILMLTEFGSRQAAFGFDAIIPVPLSAERLHERGFNQAERLAARIAALSGAPMFEALRRTRHSDKQSFKTRGARLRDTADLFKADEPELMKLLRLPASGRILLVDDIYTTGGTVNACAAAISEGAERLRGGPPPEVYVLTLARS